ncbi:MAG: hypothetical protein AAFO94_23240 [Bacteroidota bacterium]
MIFHYATEYANTNEKIAAPQDFRFTNYDDFLSFLKKRGFDYKTDGEVMLEKMRKQAKIEDYLGAVDTNIKAMETQINQIKKQDLQKYKTDIIDLIEKEIVGRYYFVKGKIQIGLRNDKEIEKAVEVLYDEKEYERVLSSK